MKGRRWDSHPRAVMLWLVCGVLVCQPRAGGSPPGSVVTLDLGEVTLTEPSVEVSVPLYLEVEPGSPAVLGWTAIVRYDPSVIGHVYLESTREASLVAFNGQERFTDPGTVAMAALYESSAGDPITTDNDGEVAQLRFCVLEGVQPGTYPLEIVESATRFGSPDLTTSVTVDGTDQRPRVEAGALIVDFESGETGCPPDVRPGLITSTFRLGSSTTSAGSEVVVPFFINVEASPDRAGEVAGYQFSIDFDEEILRVVSVDPVFELLEGGTDYGLAAFIVDNANEVPGNAGVDEGFVVGGVLFEFDDVVTDTVLPEGRDVHVVDLTLGVSPDAEIGSETSLRFVDGPRIRNILVVARASVFPEYENTSILLDGRVEIIGDVSIFRGDCNDDGAVDLSDAVCALNWLFVGGDPPGCLAVTNTNGDATSDISDATYLLNHLFLGGPPPVEPFSSCGTSELEADRQLGCELAPRSCR